MAKLTPEQEMELGTVTAWLNRASHRRIPRLQRIKKNVDRGERLSDYQMSFLGRVFKDMQAALPYFDQHPELQPMVTRMVSLYQHITEQAMRNESERLQQKAPPIDLGKR